MKKNAILFSAGNYLSSPCLAPNNLPGVNKVNKNSIGATGVIETPINTLPGVLFDFISKVPTDYDMVINFEETKSNRRGI